MNTRETENAILNLARRTTDTGFNVRLLTQLYGVNRDKAWSLLSRMVKAGALISPKRGLYQLPKGVEQGNLRASKEFFEKAFEGYDVPKDLRTASERIVASYGIRGICDPMYITNVIANEIGRGDGQGNFYSDIEAWKDALQQKHKD